MRKQCLLAIAMVCILTNARAAFTECDHGSTAGWVLLNTPNPNFPFDTVCFVPLQAGMNTVTVRIDAVPFQKARFSIPDPPFGTVVAEDWFFPHTGDRVTGVELDLGECTTAGVVTLGELQVYLETEPAGYCSLESSWLANSGEIQSCSGTWLPADGYWHSVGRINEYCCASWQVPFSLPAYDLYPADGATNVERNVVFTWTGGGYYACYVDIFTEPTCTTGQWFEVNCDLHTFAPALLLPNTTYYWRVRFLGDPNWGGGSASAYHSFTTGDIVLSTEQSTWGAVKAMYRD